MLVASAIVDLLPKLAAIGAMLWLAPLSPWQEVVGRQWWSWISLFFLDDLCYYLFHRSNHEWRLFWAGHVNHHSSRYVNLATALRQGVGERIPKYLYWLPLPLLGFDVAMILSMISLNLFYQFWIHLPGVRKLPILRFQRLISPLKLSIQKLVSPCPIVLALVEPMAALFSARFNTPRGYCAAD